MNYNESPLPELPPDVKRIKGSKSVSDAGLVRSHREIQATPIRPSNFSPRYDPIQGTENKPMMDAHTPLSDQNIPIRQSMDQEDQNLVEENLRYQKSHQSDRNINKPGENMMIKESKTFDNGLNKLAFENDQYMNEDFLPDDDVSNSLKKQRQTVYNKDDGEEEAPKLKFPESKCAKVLFIIFFPVHLIMHFCLPNIRYKPSLSKILITCIFLFVLQVLFA